MTCFVQICIEIVIRMDETVIALICFFKRFLILISHDVSELFGEPTQYAITSIDLYTVPLRFFFSCSNQVNILSKFFIE